MSVKTYVVEGMSCADCVDAVAAAVRGLPGVIDVEVDLASGRVTVGADAPMDDEVVRVAVGEAGFTLRTRESVDP